jgi:hypothetical protein
MSVLSTYVLNLLGNLVKKKKICPHEILITKCSCSLTRGDNSETGPNPQWTLGNDNTINHLQIRHTITAITFIIGKLAWG